MEDEKKYVEIEDYELARLQRLDGRVDAVQDYVDKKEYVELKDIFLILGIDMTKMEIRENKQRAAYKAKERELNAEPSCGA